jgi:hypothetical protein
MNKDKLANSSWKEGALKLYILLLLLESVGVLVYIASLPGAPKHSWLLGYSSGRWLMLLAGLAMVFSTLFLVLKSYYHCEWLRRQTQVVESLLSNNYLLGLMILFSLVSLAATAWYANYWQQHGSDQFLQAYLLRLLPFVVWLSVATMAALFLLPLFRPVLAPAYLALLVSVLCAVVIDMLTNTPEFKQMPWDTRYYYLLAERGLDSRDLIAPYVYRYLNPLLAHGLAAAFIITTFTALKIIAYWGAISQLFTIYLLTRYLGFRLRASLVAMLVTAFSMWNLKFLMFDSFRPDHLAYALMALAVLALISRHPLWCLALSAIGLQTREYLAIPPLILALFSLNEWWQNRAHKKPLLLATFSVLVTSLAVILPRLLIPATESTQFVDPSNNPATIVNLIDMPLNLGRDFNLLFTVTAYFLPLLLLATPARLKSVWARLGRPLAKAPEMRVFLVIYTGMVFLLTLYGGHDLGRYFTYAFITQVILIGFLLKEDIRVEEMIYMFVVIVIFNRLWLPIPIWDFEKYLDFYGGYAERVNLVSLMRVLELAVYIVGAFSLRAILRKKYGHSSIQP